MAGRAWSDEDEREIRTRVAGGEPWPMIAAALGRSYKSVEQKWRNMASEPTPGPIVPTVGTSHDPVDQWQRLRDQETEQRTKLADAFDWLRPVELPLIARPRVTAKPSRYVVVSSDHHWPLHDPRVEAILLQVIAALRPRAYILNGDGPDMLALSRYPKDARAGKSWELREEQRHAKAWWRAVAEVGAPWGMALYETEANHSGGGRASRWRRWLDENASVLHGLDGFEDAMRYERYFHPSDVAVQMVDEVVLAQSLRIRHGEIVRKHGGYSARAHSDKWGSSVMHGHTHRSGSSTKRRPGIPGVRDDEFLRAAEIGCVCRLDADYCPGADWVNGFAILAEDEASGTYGMELVHVVDGVATINSIGGVTLRAA